MKRYLVTFYGRRNSAIGICHDCTLTVEAENEAAARSCIYDTHEHVNYLRVTELSDGAK